ncbi:MAG: UDP-N-acetylmuramate--L-alanine ligase [Eubacteriales bacterium]
MYQLDFNQPIHIHFMGIGGISMSGLAEILLKENFQISGSDRECSPLTTLLESYGATIYYGQRSSNIKDNVALVVYTAAIKEDNPEYQEVLRRNLPTLTRAELLGQLMNNYKMPIAVSGTHGKTTTTSMISHILLEGETDPTLSIGGMFNRIHGNIRVGNSELFVTEACEYTNSFLHFNPKIGVILNVEEDHMDFFQDIHHVRNSFQKFAALIPADGHLIINGEIDSYQDLIKDLTCNIITYGIEGHYTYSCKDITYDTLARGTFTLMHNRVACDSIQIGAAGRHNISNALASIAVADLVGVSRTHTYASLMKFSGTERRFEYKGTLMGVTIIDDYAHHPTEITATLTAARNYPHKSLYCVFQPHTYTRTKAFLHDFAVALQAADYIILADVYAARETDTLGISSVTLQQEIQNLGKPCEYFPSFDEIENYLLENCINGDLLITMGAGDVVKIGDSLLGL